MSCRLYIHQPLQPGATISLPVDQAHYLRQVMRLQADDEIILFNGHGGEYLARISQLTRHESRCEVGEFVDIERELGCHIHIVQAACRSEKIDTVLQKGTELGAASFQIVRSERSTLKLGAEKLKKRLDRWQKIIVEAAEQSGRTALPHISWHDRLNHLATKGAAFCLHPEADTSLKKQQKTLASASDITLAIGPEGGWSQHDLDTLKGMGFQNLVFGNRILRTETAAPALLAAIQALRE